MRRRDLLAAAALLPAGAALAAPAPADLDWLIGSWHGDGSFMGKPSAATLEARMAIGGRFLELVWRVEAKGDKPIRYEGRGLYRRTAEGWDGHWYDSTGAIRPLTGTSTSDAFRTAWGTPTSEQGRSTYAFADGVLTVEDTVLAAQGPRIFATHTLVRKP